MIKKYDLEYRTSAMMVLLMDARIECTDAQIKQHAIKHGHLIDLIEGYAVVLGEQRKNGEQESRAIVKQRSELFREICKLFREANPAPKVISLMPALAAKAHATEANNG